MNHFRFLSVYNSPFVRPKIKWYFGKVAVGVPYSLPRKRFGFDFVDLGWKTKWDNWLYYELRTDKTKSKMERLAQCRVKFPITNTTYNGNKKYIIDWYDFILKEKYLVDHEYSRIFKNSKK